MLVEVDAERDAPWSVLLANEAWEAAVGLPRPHNGDRLPFWQLFQVRGRDQPARDRGPPDTRTAMA
jgi:hypothetical protein